MDESICINECRGSASSDREENRPRTCAAARRNCSAWPLRASCAAACGSLLGHGGRIYALNDEFVLNEAHPHVDLHADIGVLGGQVYDRVVALAAHAADNVQLVLAIGQGDDQGFPVADGAEGFAVQIETEAAGRAHKVAHPVKGDGCGLFHVERRAAALAWTGAGQVLNFAALGTFHTVYSWHN